LRASLIGTGRQQEDEKEKAGVHRGAS